MKSYLPTVLALVSAVLLIALIVSKHSDNTQMEADAASITDFSNRLDTAYSLITANQGTMLSLSNNLADCTSASVTLSNQFTATIAAQTEQITKLNGQVTATTSDNDALNRHVTELTTQVATLQNQLTLTQTNLSATSKTLADASQQNTLLQHAFQRDVAERVVVERKFNNPDALQAQLKYLKTNPAKEITADKIYAGLNVEVHSNGVAADRRRKLFL